MFVLRLCLFSKVQIWGAVGQRQSGEAMEDMEEMAEMAEKSEAWDGQDISSARMANCRRTSGIIYKRFFSEGGI